MARGMPQWTPLDVRGKYSRTWKNWLDQHYLATYHFECLWADNVDLALPASVYTLYSALAKIVRDAVFLNLDDSSYDTIFVNLAMVMTLLYCSNTIIHFFHTVPSSVEQHLHCGHWCTHCQPLCRHFHRNHHELLTLCSRHQHHHCGGQ